MISWLNFMLCFSPSLASNLEVKSETTYPGLIIHLQKGLGVACPASTKAEKKFNDKISITKNSLFVQNIGKGENSTVNVCLRPPEPAVVYDVKLQKYEIGYEVYYEEEKFGLQNERLYYDFRSVDALNYHVMNRSKLHRKHVTDYYEGIKKGTLLKFSNDSPIMVFRWITKVSLVSLSGCRTSIRSNKEAEVCDFNAICRDYKLPEEETKEIYACISAEGSKDILPDEKDLELLKPLPLLVLKKSQIFPAWYFFKNFAKIFFSAPINVVPIWKTIADGQLKKVDLYTQAVMNTLEQCGLDRTNLKLTCGVSGVTKLENHRLYSLEKKSHRAIPIPKIIYRFIESTYYYQDYNAAIIIHNDLDNISESDRICEKKDEVSGWDMITNEDHRSGLTYVCHVTERIQEKLGIRTDQEVLFTEPIELDGIPWSEYPQWSYTYPITKCDQTYLINERYQQLLLENHWNIMQVEKNSYLKT